MTSDTFHQFNSTPEIDVGNVVADALAKKGASVFPVASDWVNMDQIVWAVQQRIYATSILAAQAAPRSVSAHPEDVLHAERERTILENASSHSLVLVGKGYHCRVSVRALHQLVARWIGCAAPFAQDRSALTRPIQCASGTRRYMSRIV